MTSAVTPESLIPRSDSRNAATTCKGLTGSGRPCRRSITTAINRASRFIVLEGDDGMLEAAVFYCWQHKDQAPTGLEDIQEKLEYLDKPRTSIDTLADRLGMLDLTDEMQHSRRREGTSRPRRPAPRRPARPQQPSTWQSLCCFTIPPNDPDDRIEIVRHRHRRPPTAQIHTLPHPPHRSTIPPHIFPPDRNPAPLIPTSLDYDTAATLRAELNKPISPHDEPGYIYIFWLTSTIHAAPSEADTATLLASSPTTSPATSPSAHRPNAPRRPTDVLQHYSTTTTSTHASRPSPTTTATPAQKTVLLKIGRASNVHRRLAEWTRQCGHHVSLLRFYPYVAQPDAATPGPRASVRKVPCAHRVERLIHLELRGRRAQQDACGACGSRHREWFEVPAARAEIRAVDAVVRKWVRWAEDGARTRGG